MSDPIILSDSILVDGTVTATSTASGFDVANLKDLRTYTLWKAINTVSPQYITIDFGTAVSVDSLGVINHNMHTNGGLFSVEGADDSAFAGGDLVNPLTDFDPTDDNAFIKTFTTNSKRWWRIKLSHAGAFSAAPYMGVAILGEFLDIPYGIQAPYSDAVESPQMETTNSRGGNILGSIVNFTKITIDTTILWPTWAYMRDTFKPFWDDHGSQGKPFFYSWDNATYPEDAKFVKFRQSMVYNTPFTEDSKHPSFVIQMEGIKE